MTIIDSPLPPFARVPHPAPVPRADREAALDEPVFGRGFTDHMALVEWSESAGWHDARIVPYGPLDLDPSAAVLHYGQEVFEGIKAYHHADGSIRTFRPDRNAERMRRSARRLALPEPPTELFVESLRQLVAADRAWVPDGEGQSLYLRPFLFASEAFLGVRSARTFTYCVIASPAGSYFAGDGARPVSLWVSGRHARAGAGGTGAAKTGANYAASLLPHAEAREHGCDQTLFLDERGNVEEAGSMNIVLVRADGTLVTPESESILAGVTLDSVLRLAADRGHLIERRAVSLDEWRSGVASGEIVEAFACGTAAVVTPIGRLSGDGFDELQPVGGLAPALRRELTDIQYGRAEDRHGWLVRLVG